MFARKKRALAAIVPMAFAAGAAAEGEVRLGDVSVTSASGYEQNLKDASASVSVITKEDITEKPARDLGELIEDIPGVDVNLNASSGTQTFQIRGFNSDYTLFLVDGKRQNPAYGMFANGMNSNIGSFIPPVSMIERVEVIKGPASTLYGSDAVGGVINIITKKHPGKASGALSLETQAQEHSVYGNRYGINGYVAAPLVQDTLSYSLKVKANKKNASGLRWPAAPTVGIPDSRVWNSKTTSTNFGGSLTYSLNPANTFSLGLERSIDSSIMQSGGTGNEGFYKYVFKKDNLVFNHDGDYDFGTTNTYLQYNHMWNNNSFKGLDSKIMTLESKAIVPLYDSLVASFGVRADNEKLKVRKGSRVQAFPGTKEQTTVALYGEGEYYISDNLIFTGGLRYIRSDIFGSQITPRAYMVWNLNDNITIKGGVSMGYKTPSAKDLNTGLSDMSSDSARFGNTSLQPEESINYEIGTDMNLAGVGHLTATAFMIDFENKLHTEQLIGNIEGINCVSVRDPRLPRGIEFRCSKPVNLHKTRTKGLELGFKSRKFNGFSVNAAYTLMDQKYNSGKNSGKRIEALPKHIASLKLNYEQGKFSSYLKGRARLDTLVGGRSKTRDFTKYDDFYVLDAGLTYKINKNNTISVAVNNLLDKNFFTPFYDTSGRRAGYKNSYQDLTEGRNLWINYRYEF